MTNLSGANLNNGAAVGRQGEGRESPSNFPKYPEYKDSGVEWLGEVPNHWVKSSIKHVAAINMGQSPNSDDCNTDGVGLPFLQGNGEFGTKYPTPKQYCPVARKIADAGDLLFSVRAPVGALNEADQIYGIGRGLCAMKASRDISKEFLWWFLSSSQSFLDSISTGSTFEAVSAEQVANIAIALPRGVVEQTQIARFLDHETARIDALIEEQQRLIELLKEKRQAVISHAVTKGLDPTVPMKDSGVEWLGEVPAHWVITRVKYLCYVNDGNHGEEYPKSDDFTTEDNGVPFIRGGNLENYTVSDLDMLFITPEKNRSMRKGRLVAGDILFVNRGEIGKLALVPSAHTGSNLNSQIAYLRLASPEFVNEFLMYYLDGEGVKSLIASSKEGSVLTQFPIGDLNSIYVAAPPKSEQEQIVSFLAQQVDGFDALVSEATIGVELLKERRSALISAAVTGKIDVRNW